ncbi:hypothetical protein CsatB_009154 [Cannabis sativa]
MALTMKQFSLIVGFSGVLSFIFGVVAEYRKPASGTPIPEIGVDMCKYPSDWATVALGYLSIAFLIVSTIFGIWSLFYPYKGKSIPKGKLLRSSTTFMVFFNTGLFTAGIGAALLLWPTLTEQFHLMHNVHHSNSDCPTAKTGLLGGGAFVSLDSTFFWLVTLMLAKNARRDYFEQELENDEHLHLTV